MEAAAVLIEVVDELFGGDVIVKGAGMAQVAVPDFIDRVPDEFCGGAFSRFVGGEVTDEDGMYRFTAGAGDGGGIVGNVGICRRAVWDREWCPVCGDVRGG